uniref:G-protein coupled receptors family 1 profile domain-containing protein n=1 Tax=Amphiprion percula TaxID=161767 RepID=A0A3P8TP96_AMPPE
MEIQDGAELCFPQLLNTSCRKKTPHQFEDVLLNIVMSSLSVLIVVLNLLVIISVSHFRQLHTPTNILLLSLAVSDFLVGLLLLQTTCWFLGDIMCSVHFYLSCNIVIVSIGNIVLISTDRYMAVCDPLHYPTKFTMTRVKLCICLCWLYSGFYSGLIVLDDLRYPGKYNSCYGECVVIITFIAGITDLVFTFLLPVSVITILYITIFVVAVSQARAMRSHITAVSLQVSVSLTTKKSELKAARTLGVLIIVYLICFCPFYCVVLAGDNTSSASFVAFVFHFNSCLNPLIYALFYPWFRKAIKLIVTLQIVQSGSREANIL